MSRSLFLALKVISEKEQQLQPSHFMRKKSSKWGPNSQTEVSGLFILMGHRSSRCTLGFAATLTDFLISFSPCHTFPSPDYTKASPRKMFTDN